MTVAQRLFAEPWKFEFFEAVRLLELLYPGRTSPGEGAYPGSEVVRLRSLISFVFPASEIQTLREPESEDSPATMTVNLLPLGGPQGPLPDPDADRVIDETWHRNPAFAEFLDIFHHRLLSLLVRAKKIHHPSYTAGRPEQGPVAHQLYSFFGLGLSELRDRLLMADRSLLFYSGILAQHPRSASGLERLLADYFRAPVRVNQFQGLWRYLEASQWTLIGPGGRNRELGGGALLGTRVWDQQGRFELAIGPLELPLFLNLLPRGSGFEPLCELTRFYVGPDLDFGFRLTLHAAAVPGTRLGASWLGWTSWIRTRPFTRDDSQVRISSRRPADPFSRHHVQAVLR